MAAYAAISLSSIISTIGTTSDAAIGVDRTYSPAGFNSAGVAMWEERSGGIPVGFPTVTLFQRRPVQGSRNFKTTVKLSIPTLEVTAPTTVTGIQPAPTKAYANELVMDWICPERATLAEREQLFRMALSLLMSTITASDGTPTNATGSPIFQTVVNLDKPY